MLAHFAKVTSTKDDSELGHIRERLYAERVARLENAADEIRVPLQAMRIGDLGITAIPFETFVEIGLALKESSPFSQSFTIELANGNYGYLPTPQQHRLGGYETWLGTNIVEYGASTKIVKALLDLCEKLHRN